MKKENPLYTEKLIKTILKDGLYTGNDEGLAGEALHFYKYAGARYCISLTKLED